jgi:hypothetical protein
MCNKLGIEIIAASSPQAKGRVERNHGTHQDRLVKKLRLGKVSSIEEAHRYLEEKYCAEHNTRFAVRAAAPQDFHLPSPGGRKLETIFRLERERVLSNDWVVRDENHFYQVERQRLHHAPAKSKVTVCEWEDGRIEIYYRGQKLSWKRISERPLPSKPEDNPRVLREETRKKWKPGPDHPWRMGFSPGSAPALVSASASP